MEKYKTRKKNQKITQAEDYCLVYIFKLVTTRPPIKLKLVLSCLFNCVISWEDDSTSERESHQGVDKEYRLQHSIQTLKCLL
jgi:hypothetical protein